jgi:hypothetical protein
MGRELVPLTYDAIILPSYSYLVTFDLAFQNIEGNDYKQKTVFLKSSGNGNLIFHSSVE